MMERKGNMDDYKRSQLMTLKMKDKGFQKQQMNMSNYLNSVQTMASKFEIENPNGVTEEVIDGITDPNDRQMAQSRKAYYKELKKVIEASDVIC